MFLIATKDETGQERSPISVNQWSGTFSCWKAARREARPPRFVRLAALIGAVAFTIGVSSAQEFVNPAETIHAYDIPAVPVELARRADAYGDFRSATFTAWHPERLEMLILTRFADTNQVHRVAAAGSRREQLTFFREPVLGVSAFDEKDGAPFFTFSMDRGGDEFYQVYRFDPESGAETLLTDGVKRNGGGVYSEETGLLAYPRFDADAEGAFTEIHVVNPLDPSSDRCVTTQRGGGWGPGDWSTDGKRLLAREYVSINDARVWVIDVQNGTLERLLPKSIGVEPIFVGAPRFSPDGGSIYVISDEGVEFRDLVRVDLNTGARTVLSEAVDWDVADFDVSPDGAYVAFVTNEAGRSRLNAVDAAGRRIELPGIPSGIIGGLDWHNDSRHLAFTVSTAAVPGDVFVVDVPAMEVERWTYSETGVNTGGFAEAELIEWESFDQQTISGFLYRPPAKFTGKRPVVLVIHGGPEGQSLPGYLGRWNYFLDELGAALIYPNVRGSSGYGKSFLKLDNGELREGTYKDIGALFEWIAREPGLDAKRVMVYGGSYGGHMTLATAARYPEQIACAVSLFGISNLRTFLENTEDYRRDLRRVEYGDERDPELRAWMDASAPLANVERMLKPLMVQQGVNDPRVPKSESDQIVERLKAIGTPAWYLVFDDEGHGWRKKPNADYAFYSTILFAENYLLAEPR